MIRILIVAETAGGQATRATLELVGAARALSGEAKISILPLFGTPEAVADLARYGAVLEPEALMSDYVPARAAAILRAAVAADAPDLVLTSYSLAGVELGPLASAQLGGICISGVMAAGLENGALDCVALLYDGKLTAQVSVPLPACATLLVGANPPAEPLPETAPVAMLPIPEPSVMMRAVPVPAETGSVDISAARKIVSVGRGIGSADKIAGFQDLAALLGAELGSSRPVVDNGWLPKSRQVGKSGRSVRPDLYLALGISGAVEHLEGIVGADYVVAVNTDEDAPIFRRADLAIACDMSEFAETLSEALRSRNG